MLMVSVGNYGRMTMWLVAFDDLSHGSLLDKNQTGVMNETIETLSQER